MIRLIASDIDGTLVPDGTDQINTDIYEAIRRLSDKGITFVGASGRQYASIRRLFRPVSDMIYYVTDGGGMVIHNGAILASVPIEASIVHELAEDILSISECDVMLCGEKSTYAPDAGSRMFHWLKDDYHFDIMEKKDIYAPLDDKIVKVSLYHPADAEGVAMRSGFTDKWKNRLKVSCAGSQWMDCMHPEANKGTALKKIQEKLGITPEETMTFGDNINDIEMLSQSAFSYAVGNARDEVKRTARYIADTNVNDGVLKELNKLLGQLEA